jgi:HEAT repeat protein
LIRKEGYAEAAPDLWRVVTIFSDPLVKAEALMALGELQATDYLPYVIRILRNLNVAPTLDPEGEERLAYGAIVSLEKYQDPSGYVPVYVAALPSSWYSKRIKEQANKSLSAMSDDPTPAIIEVIKGAEHDFHMKYTILQAVQASEDLDDEKKSEIAVEALAEAWKLPTNYVANSAIVASLRGLAISMIAEYGVSEDSGDDGEESDEGQIYRLLDKSYIYGFDIYEKSNAVDALATLGTDEAAEQLAQYLMEMNVRRQLNLINADDDRIVRELITAVGKTKSSKGKAAVMAVRAFDWSPAVKAHAKKTLEGM